MNKKDMDVFKIFIIETLIYFNASPSVHLYIIYAIKINIKFLLCINSVFKIIISFKWDKKQTINFKSFLLYFTFI